MKKSLIFISVLVYAKIIHYEPVFYCINGSTAVIRTYIQNGEKKQIEVNLNTLKTKISAFSQTQTKCPENCRYFHLLNIGTKPPYPLQNDGIIKGKNSIFITADLCPSSKKGFEKRLFLTLIKNFKKPSVTLFITSKWIQKHKNAFFQLIRWQKKHKLDILWANHTATHPYTKGVALKHNFALKKGYNLKSDILKLEKTLLEYNLTPSVFFRFPGLVSNKKAVMEVKKLSLIPIGSNSWLAKGEMPKKGSIILLHANKNEPKGVKIFLKLLKEGKIKDIKSLNSI